MKKGDSFFGPECSTDNGNVVFDDLLYDFITLYLRMVLLQQFCEHYAQKYSLQNITN